MKNFRRVYLTIDDEVLVRLDINPATVTGASLREELKELANKIEIIQEDYRRLKTELCLAHRYDGEPL